MKAELRKQFRRARRALDAGSRASLDARIRDHLLDHLDGRPPGTLAAFWPHDGEPDLRPALEQLHARGWIVCLPVLAADDTMHLAAWTPATDMRPNRYGIPEPAGTPEHALDTLGTLLMPLVAFDATGGRLGMGAGYYDRLLAGHRDATRPRRVGIAYGLQQAEEIPLDAWDAPLHAVLTENGWLDCSA